MTVLKLTEAPITSIPEWKEAIYVGECVAHNIL